MSKNALVIGSTGLIGSNLYPKLVEFYEKVYVVSRRDVNVLGPRIEVIPFDQANGLDVEDFFNCLGTTIKKAGSREVFKEIDIGIPKSILERNPSIKRVFNISSLGANSDSGSFYLSCKGQLENYFNHSNLELVVNYRPSTLDGDREEVRKLEALGIRCTRFLRNIKPLRKFAPTPISNVVSSIIQDLNLNTNGRIVRNSAYLNHLQLD